MGLGISPLTFKIMFESDPLKSIILVRRLAVRVWHGVRHGMAWSTPSYVCGLAHMYIRNATRTRVQHANRSRDVSGWVAGTFLRTYDSNTRFVLRSVFTIIAVKQLLYT